MRRLSDYSELFRQSATTCPEHTPPNGEDWREWDAWAQCAVLDMIKGCTACLELTRQAAQRLAQRAHKQPVSAPRWWYDLDHSAPCNPNKPQRVYQWDGCPGAAILRLEAWTGAVRDWEEGTNVTNA
jgi:hypothetical protein